MTRDGPSFWVSDELPVTGPSTRTFGSRMMKKIAILVLMAVVLLILAWQVGNLWADQIVREKKMDDVTARVTRLNCQVKAIGGATMLSFIVMPIVIAWIRSRNKKEATAEPAAGALRHRNGEAQR